MANGITENKNNSVKAQEVFPINPKAKDTFFKKVYEKEERQRELAAFLLGLSGRKVSTANVRPVLFGNKENDFACLCDDVFYILAEEQSSLSPNIPYRMLEYATAGLRSMVDSEQLLYGQTRVQFPIPKLYMLQVGLAPKPANLRKDVQYEMYLHDAYLPADENYGTEVPKPDLDATVHVYDFRMTLAEVLIYIEENILPQRFSPYNNDLRNYALVANGITYMQRAGRDNQYTMPVNVSTVAEYLKLMLDREIFVDLLSDKEVCDMTMAQFSRDDILIYQGREEGREEGRVEGRVEGIKAFVLDKLEDGVTENIIIEKLQKHFMLDEQTARQYYRAYAK